MYIKLSKLYHYKSVKYEKGAITHAFLYKDGIILFLQSDIITSFSCQYIKMNDNVKITNEYSSSISNIKSDFDIIDYLNKFEIIPYSDFNPIGLCISSDLVITKI